MKLIFRQRLFSWFDSYDIYDEEGRVLFSVQGGWARCLKIFDAAGSELGLIRERILSWLPRFELYIRGEYVGCIKKEFSFMAPKFQVDCNDWHMIGDIMEWNYEICDGDGALVATVSRQFLKLTDTYVLDVFDPRNSLCVLMLALAMDAEKEWHS